jgi:hypothetical protein
MAAPRLAQLDPAIAGLIVLAGAARPIEEVLVEQLEYVLSLEKYLSEQEKAKVEKIKKEAARLTDPKLSPDVGLKSYPKLNHLFREGEGKARPAEYDQEGHVVREVIDDIAAGVKKH